MGMLFHVLRPLLLTAAISAVWACGSDHGGTPTQPSPQPMPARPPAPVVVHDTLQPAENRDVTRLYSSFAYVDEFGRVGPFSFVVDDFVSTISGQLRSVAWQGGYCDPRFQVAEVVPPPVARSFEVILTEDSRGGPAFFNTPLVTPLLTATFTPAEAQEQRVFDVLRVTDIGCGAKVPAPFSYYRYSITVPRPVEIIAGRRYWLRVLADIGSSGLVWGWRGGTADNAFTWSSFSNTFYPADMAFSVTVQ